MISSQVAESLLGQLKPKLELHGFLAYSTAFVRESEHKQDIIQIGVRQKSGDLVSISYGARVRFPVLEELIRGSSATQDLVGTYGGLSHLLAGKSYYDWTIQGFCQLPEVCEALLFNMEMVAFPFFARHQNLKSLLIALDEDRVLTYNSEDCVIYRSAIYWVSGLQEQAINVLEDALKVRQDQLPKKRVRIERLLHKLESKRNSSSD